MTIRYGMIEAKVLVAGQAEGPALVLGEPLSFWGGLDPATGGVIDRRHPQHGIVVTGQVLVMPSGRGSSSSSAVLAEAVRLGTGPAAILLSHPDAIIAIGAMVAAELYGSVMPVLAVDAARLATLRTGNHIAIDANGKVSVT